MHDKYAKPLILQANDNVLIQRQLYDKFKSVYEGPFVVKSVDDCNVRVYDGTKKKKRTVHKDRVRKLWSVNKGHDYQALIWDEVL